MAARIAVIEGDGIGHEVIPATVELLEGLGLGLEMIPFDIGAERFLATGEAASAQMLADLGRADAILLGAIGDPRIDDPSYTAQTLLAIRSGLDLYANVRPARMLDPRLSPLRDVTDVDITVVRENTEGLYTSLGGRIGRGTTSEVAIQEHISTYRGVTRILERAFALARREVCLADKWNAMPHAGGIWQERWRKISAANPDVPSRHLMIDACALALVVEPTRFDVVVSENCFGDILSDVAAAVVGGLGVVPSANLGDRRPGMFEPVHGSAPDIAGSQVANPAAAILAAGLMLDQLGWPDEAEAIEAAVRATVRAGDCTRDLGGSLSTIEAARAVARRVHEA